MIGVKDDKWGERPLALVVKRPPMRTASATRSSRTTSRAFADQGIISKYGIPEKILFIDSIPKTQRRQDQQEGTARAIRRHLAIRTQRRLIEEEEREQLHPCRFEERVGQELGVSDWVTIDQPRIDAFASCTGDRQWIHVDVERAKRESPFRGPIAHGYLTLAMVAPLGDGGRRHPEVTPRRG